jgi:fructose-1,6-bisphosphatase/inositol monophosphatase family enzyme
MASLERRVAVDAARAAGHLLKSELLGPRRIAYKDSPTNLVTEMDARAEEAGGRITNLSGGALDLDAPSQVASNSRIHDAVLAVLAELRGGGAR